MSDRVFTPPCDVNGPKGAYHVEAFLGRGGFGESYRGRTAHGRPVTLKVLRPERLDSWKSFDLFEREAKALAALDHPRVPKLVELFPLVGNRVVLVSSYVPGRSLQTIIDGGERLDPARAERLARELLQVLDYLHTRPDPVIHRDIKPSNVIIDDSGQAHLIDFGAIQTRILAAGEAGSTIIGTLGYFPQEQLLGRAVPSSDLYALGMTLLVGISGRPPEAQSMHSSTGKALPPPGLPAPLARFLTAVLEPGPGSRPASARAALGVLDGRMDMILAGPKVRTIAELPPGRARVERWLYRATLGGGVGAAGIVNLLMFNHLSESKLVSIAPYWLAPILFGAAGLIALPRRSALRTAFIATALGLIGLFVFLVGIFPSL